MKKQDNVSYIKSSKEIFKMARSSWNKGTRVLLDAGDATPIPEQTPVKTEPLTKENMQPVSQISNDIPSIVRAVLKEIYGEQGASSVVQGQGGFQDPDEPVSTTGTMLDAAPMPKDSYVIKSGDTLSKIAADNPFTLTQLIESNPQIEDPNKIEVGQQLNFPPAPANVGTKQTGLGTYGSADDTTDLEILARTIEAEARGESKEGKLAVGAVIANRATSNTYGGSIRGAILKKAQFSPWNGYTNYQKGISQAKPMLTKKMAPSKDSYEAAKKILSGNYEDPTGGAVHYLNPKVRKPNWYTAFKNQSRGTITIGRHEFGNADSSRTYDGKSKIKEQIRQTLNN